MLRPYEQEGPGRWPHFWGERNTASPGGELLAPEARPDPLGGDKRRQMVRGNFSC
jgi:hypothetical protein